MSQDLNEVLNWVRDEKAQILTATTTDFDTYNRFQRVSGYLLAIETLLVKEIASLTANSEPVTVSGYNTPLVDNRYFK